MASEVTTRLLAVEEPTKDDIVAAIREIQRLSDEILDLRTRIHYLNEELLTRG